MVSSRSMQHKLSLWRFVLVPSRRVRKGPGRRPMSLKRQQFMVVSSGVAARRCAGGRDQPHGKPQLAQRIQGLPERRHSTFRATPGPIDHNGDLCAVLVRSRADRDCRPAPCRRNGARDRNRDQSCTVPDQPEPSPLSAVANRPAPGARVVSEPPVEAENG